MGAGQCGGLLDTAQETLVLAFKVAESTLLDSPEMIERILRDSKVRKAIETAATSQAKELVQKQQQGKAVSQDDVKTGAAAVAQQAGKAIKDAGIAELEKTAKATREYKLLEHSLKELECAWKKSPVGVFVDKNKGLLIVVGAGLALQGAIAMYRFKAGDMIAGPATSLATKLVKFKVLGNVEIAAKEIRFVPSKQEVGTKMLVTATWERVKVSFEAGITLQNTTVTQANGRADLSVKVAHGVSVKAHGAYQYKAPESNAPWKNPHQYDLGLGLTYENAFGNSKLSITTMMFATQDAEVTKYGGKAGVNLRLLGKPAGTSLNLNVDAAANQRTTRTAPELGSGPQTQGEVTGKLGLSLNF